MKDIKDRFFVNQFGGKVIYKLITGKGDNLEVVGYHAKADTNLKLALPIGRTRLGNLKNYKEITLFDMIK